MKPSEFYRDYWYNNNKLNNPPLIEMDALIMDIAAELNVPMYIRVKKRGGDRIEVHPEIKKRLTS